MIKAGQSGSTINDVIYMGDVVNQAAKLASMGGKAFTHPMMVDSVFSRTSMITTRVCSRTAPRRDAIQATSSTPRWRSGTPRTASDLGDLGSSLDGDIAVVGLSFVTE
jgi:hypothetical protein